MNKVAKHSVGPTYLDCCATTPIDPRVASDVIHFMTEEFGNAGSRTHEYGARAKKAVEQARDSIAKVVSAKRDEIVFTSGATESNNLAILGMAQHGIAIGKRHIVSTQIEHNSVLEPLQELKSRGFEVTLVAPTEGGWLSPESIRAAVRPDTLLVSIMQANNETGVLQPIEQIARALSDHPAFFHVDAAQSFGKEPADLSSQRLDLISISGHKIFAPKGVGALVARRRGFGRVPLSPITFGGGQERGLRPGTLPVHLIVGLGRAADLALSSSSARTKACQTFRSSLTSGLAPLRPIMNGDQSMCLANVVNLSFPGLDSEAVIVALKDVIACSNGSACTSESYKLSHVLASMALPEDRIRSAVRLSWCHMTPPVDWGNVVRILRQLS